MWWVLLDEVASVTCVVPKMTDQGYYYIRIPDGRGYKKIWVNRAAIVERTTKNGDVSASVLDWLDYRKTSKGNIVLLPNPRMDSTVVVLQGACGYRGHSTVSGTFETILRGAYYHSPAGRIGIDDVIVAKVREGDIIELSRSGRLYGRPKNVTFKIMFGGDKGLDVIVSDEESDPELKKLL